MRVERRPQPWTTVILAYSSSICPKHKYYTLTGTQCYSEQANYSSAEPVVVQPDKSGLLQEA